MQILGLDRQIFCEHKNVIIGIILNMFWWLKRTVSLRRFFECPQDMFWQRNKKMYLK